MADFHGFLLRIKSRAEVSSTRNSKWKCHNYKWINLRWHRYIINIVINYFAFFVFLLSTCSQRMVWKTYLINFTFHMLQHTSSEMIAKTITKYYKFENQARHWWGPRLLRIKSRAEVSGTRNSKWKCHNNKRINLRWHPYIINIVINYFAFFVFLLSTCSQRMVWKTYLY